MPKSIQMIRLESGSYMSLQEIMFTGPTSGRLRFCANPVALRREEIFTIQGEQVSTESFHFPTQYLFKWLAANDAIDLETMVVSNFGFEDMLNNENVETENESEM